MSGDILSRQDPLINGRLIQFPLPSKKSIAAATEENPVSTSHHRVRQFPGQIGLRLAIKMDADAVAFADQHHMMPGILCENRMAHEQFIARISIKQNELAHDVRAERAADSQVLATGLGIALGSARKRITGHRPGIGSQAIPEPHFHGIGITQFHIRLHATACEMIRPALRRLRVIKARKIHGHAVLERGIVRIHGILCRWHRHFIQMPVSVGLGGHHDIGIRQRRRGQRPTWLARDAFQELQQYLHNLWLRLHFQSGGPGRPRGVTAQRMLLRRWNVTLGTIGEFDVERRGKGTLRLEFQAGDGKDFIWQRGDAKIANAHGLEDEFRFLALVQMDGFRRVNFRQRLRQAIAHFRHHLLRPGQAFRIRNTVVQREFRFLHSQRHGGMPCNLPIRRRSHCGHFPRVGIVADLLFRRSIIHPHQIAAGALRHHADKRFRRTDLRGEMFRKAPEIIRREQIRAIIMHGIIRQQRQRLSIQRLRRQQGQSRIHRPGRPHGIRTLMARMHVRPDVHLSKRIREHAIRPANPPPIKRMLPVIDRRPPHPGRLEIFYRRNDRFGNFPRQHRGIFRVDPTSQTPHRRRRRMRVRGADQHLVRRNARRFRCLFLRGINEVASHHASVHDAENNLHFPIIHRQRPRRQRIHHLVARTFGKHGIHPHRKFRRTDVHNARPRPKRRPLRGSSQGNGHSQQGEWKD